MGSKPFIHKENIVNCTNFGHIWCRAQSPRPVVAVKLQDIEPWKPSHAFELRFRLWPQSGQLHYAELSRSFVGQNINQMEASERIKAFLVYSTAQTPQRGLVVFWKSAQHTAGTSCSSGISLGIDYLVTIAGTWRRLFFLLIHRVGQQQTHINSAVLFQYPVLRAEGLRIRRTCWFSTTDRYCLAFYSTARFISYYAKTFRQPGGYQNQADTK